MLDRFAEEPDGNLSGFFFLERRESIGDFDLLVLWNYVGIVGHAR